MVKVETSWRPSDLNEHHFVCECRKHIYFDNKLTLRVTKIKCPECGCVTEYVYESK